MKIKMIDVHRLITLATVVRKVSFMLEMFKVVVCPLTDAMQLYT